jgi:hypothetical protein
MSDVPNENSLRRFLDGLEAAAEAETLDWPRVVVTLDDNGNFFAIGPMSPFDAADEVAKMQADMLRDDWDGPGSLIVAVPLQPYDNQRWHHA